MLCHGLCLSSVFVEFCQSSQWVYKGGSHPRVTIRVLHMVTNMLQSFWYLIVTLMCVPLASNEIKMHAPFIYLFSFPSPKDMLTELREREERERNIDVREKH